MSGKSITVVACLLALQWLATIEPATAQSVVEQNSNVVGRTLPGYYRGIPAMQDNEASCAINPILPRNIVCAWNASGGSDDAIGDTWLRFSESLDGGRTFYNRYLNGSNLDPATSVGQQFGADPVMMCWPGGCGTVMLAATRAERGGEGGGIYMQWMADINTEAGFRKAFKVNLDQVYNSTGSHFADKPHALYLLDEENPGTVEVTMDVEMPDGTVQQLTRSWPKARIIVVFSLFNPSKNDIEILSMYTDDYTNWSNPRQVAQTSGQDQGVSLAAIGDTVFYGFRRFANSGDNDDFMGVVSNDRGHRMGKPFVVASDVCTYDVPTLPATDESSLAAARTNDFPWVSQDGSNFIMVFSARRPSEDGGCMTLPTDPLYPPDSRIVAMIGSDTGKKWEGPFEVDRNPEHGFQFMPVVECSLGICQVAWWDSRRDSARTLQFLGAQGGDFANAAADYFKSVPILADFNFPPDGEIGSVIQFRRTADMYTKKVRITGDSSLDTSEPVTRASRYRQVPYGDQLVEREFNPFNVKAYKTNAVPFMSDYSSMTSVRHRYVFDPDNLSQPPFWESNAGPNPLPNALNEPLFWLAWTDARNMRGQIYTAEIDGQPPYARTPDAPPPESPMTGDNNTSTVVAEESLTAESVEDYNPLAGVCERIDPDPMIGDRPGGGEVFYALNNRVKDSDIYGAMIENRATAWSLNPTKTLGAIQRTYVIVVENERLGVFDGKLFRLEIMNQPVGYEDAPKTARASWKQLPFELSEPDFQTLEPEERTFEAVGPQSSASVALFLVSEAPVNPVTVNIYEVTSDPEDPAYDPTLDVLVNSVVVNGSIESGPLLDLNGDPNIHEEHNPYVYAPDPSDPSNYNLGHYENANPDLFNPDLYNPDLFNPDLFNPDLFNPDLFNPDLYNPDLFNPDLFNPDLFNPDLFNPDLFNPDLFNPDLFNPDLFNTTLTDSDMLHNAEIPQPALSPSTYDADGMVSKVDVQFGIQNVGNTLTPYTVDFALSDPEVLQLIADGYITTQVIAWRNKKIDDVQFCDHQLVTENRVIAAENNPDLTQLQVPTILNNRVGALTYFVAPGDILQTTLRFIGPKAKVQQVEKALKNDIISYVFTAETANTGTRELFDVEQVINNRTPPVFEFMEGANGYLEAEGPHGATLPDLYVTASRSGADVPVTCAPALGSPLDLQIPPVAIPLTCTATTDNGVTSTLDTTITVRDTEQPFFTSDPPPLTRDAESPLGAYVDFDLPLAEDTYGVDTMVDVICDPAPGSLFPFTAPELATEVECIAYDDSGNPSDPVYFDVIIWDTSPPVIGGDIGYEPDIPPITLTASQSSYLLNWDFAANDADAMLAVECDPGGLPVSASHPLYEFSHNFQIGLTPVSCRAEDGNGLSDSISFSVEIIDIHPPEIDLNGANPLTVDMGSGPYEDPGATAVDNEDPNLPVTLVIDDSAVDTTTAGTYSVTITATDEGYPSANTSTATRTVIVEFSYGMTGIIPAKTNVKMGSSNPLRWAWLDAAGNALDTSADVQRLRIENCATGEVVARPASDTGSSYFRLKEDNWWQYNWETSVPAGGTYCAYVVSGLTLQEMGPVSTVKVR